MKTIKYFLLSTAIFLFLSISTNSYSQTKMIAHKSHSGSSKTFTPNSAGNFGEPFHFQLDTIVKLTDTSVVEIRTFMEMREVDTIFNHRLCNNPEIGFDSLKIYYPHIALIGFEESANKEQENKTPIVVPSILEEDSNKENDENSIPLLGFIVLTTMLLLGFIFWTQNLKQLRMGSTA